MSDSVLCPQCLSSLTREGQFWICPHHGRVPLGGPRVPKRLFISYGHDEHSSLARRLWCDLRDRGHEVWFDEDRLMPGHDWEAFIEAGLEHLAADKANAAVVLLLTPHSVRRPDGFCLNEIARALGRGLRIIPLMVVDSEPPLSICRIQWLDMRACIPISEKEASYGPRFDRLLRAIEEDALDFEGSQQRLIRVLQPLEFGGDLSAYVSRFTGREWVFEAVQRWLTEPPSQRVFWITGGPGVGKTALSAALSNRCPEVAAFHLCRFGHAQKSDPRRVVTSLAYQLSTQLPSYEARLITMDLESLVKDDAGTMFDNLLVQPLTKLDQPSHPIVIVIDALDEATVEGRNELATFIAAEFPRTPIWLRMIITARPEHAVTSPLQALDRFVLDTATDANRSDVRAHLWHQLAPLLLSRQDAKCLVEQILDKSEGVFLYAQCACHDLQRGYLSLDRLDQFPQGLGGVYWQFLQRQFPDLERFRKDTRPALRAILAAREPLPLAVLQHLFFWHEEEQRDFTRSLGSLFSVFTEDGQVVITPYHRSLTEFLTDEARAGQYFVSLQEGHRLLADYCWQGHQEAGRHTELWVLRHLLTHLRLAGQTDKVFSLTEDDEFLSRFLSVCSPEALRREMKWSWAAAVAQGTDTDIGESHPTTAYFAHGLHLAERGHYTEAIGTMRQGVPGSAATIAALAWNEACWLAKDHLPPAEARTALAEGARYLSDALMAIGDDAQGVLCIEVARTIGWMLKDLGLATESCSAFQTALALSERTKNARQLAWSARDLGCCYRDAHDFDQSRHHLRCSITWFDELGDERQLAISLKDLGLLELEQASGRPIPSDAAAQAAVAMLERSLRLAEGLGDAEIGAWVERYLGLAEALTGEGDLGRRRIAGTAEQFLHFRDTNCALSRFCAEHAEQIRRPTLIERFGHSHHSDGDFRELLR